MNHAERIENLQAISEKRRKEAFALQARIDTLEGEAAHRDALHAALRARVAELETALRLIAESANVGTFEHTEFLQGTARAALGAKGE